MRLESRERGLEAICRSGSSIVWCPTSNLFTLGRTLTAETLRSRVPIALGSDSALTGEGDLINEMACAAKVAAFSANEIYPLVTANPAGILRLTAGQGMIREKGVADLVAVKDMGQTPAEALVDLRPELVVVGGRVMLLSSRFRAQTSLRFKDLNPIHVEGLGNFLIRADVPRLYAGASMALGTELRLAGRRICH